jgi:LemA protein
MQLQQRITSLEGLISDRRELYNESVNVNNVRVESFPDAILARMFNFRQKSLLEFEASEKADVDMRKLFS